MSHSLEMRVHDDKKLVEVWLTKAEKDDPRVQAELITLYAQYKSRKYMVARVPVRGAAAVSHHPRPAGV